MDGSPDNIVVPAHALTRTLRVNEIFFSLQGETSRVGLPTIFIRLGGCPLRCGFCDTAYAFHDARSMTLAQILDAAATYQTRYVTVTGGEPLAQKDCMLLMNLLCDRGYSVSLETSGALAIADVDTRVSRILDVKTPASGEVDKNLWSNFAHLNSRDEIKFVLCSDDDYEWAKGIIAKHRMTEICPVLLSPSYHDLPAQQLAEWILRDQLPVRMQVQLHKFLWGEQQGR